MEDNKYKLISCSIIQNAIGLYLEECGYRVTHNKWYINAQNHELRFSFYFYDCGIGIVDNPSVVGEKFLLYCEPDFCERLDQILFDRHAAKHHHSHYLQELWPKRVIYDDDD